MHEFSLCEALLRQLEALAAAHDAEVVRLNVQIGPLSGVEPELLEAAFSVARAGTRAKNARLLVERMPVRVYCAACGTTTETASHRLACGGCGASDTALTGGDELLLRQVELSLTAKEPEPCATPAAVS